MPPSPMVKPDTPVEPEFATYRNWPSGFIVMPTGVAAAPVVNVAGVVGVNNPPAPMVNAATSFMPLFVTYRKEPFGEMTILWGLDPSTPVEKVGGTVGVSAPPSNGKHGDGVRSTICNIEI